MDDLQNSATGSGSSTGVVERDDLGRPMYVP